MKIKEITQTIEKYAPTILQESYDNAGWQVGNPENEISGVLICLDITEEVIDEAIALNFNLIISHHPLIFKGLKSITGANYIERCIKKALVNDITLYSAHTNLDNTVQGVNFKIAEQIGLTACSFLHPNLDGLSGSGIIGELPNAMEEKEFLLKIKEIFQVGCIKHSPFLNKKIKKIAICGGAGSFLIKDAIAKEADLFLTGDIKYHDYFLVEKHLLLADFGHYESEQYTKDLIFNIIQEKNSIFAVQKTKVNTNPINYL